jgi:hypothetical protein
VLFLLRKKKDLFGDSFWSFLYQIYVKGLVYNFHHLISLKQLGDFNNLVPYVRFYSLYLEVKLNNAETSYLNLPTVSE